MTRQILTLFGLLMAALPLAAQEYSDSATGLVGREIMMPIRMIDPAGGQTGAVALGGSFLITNPTVFYPERFVPAAGDSIIASSLTRLTDSTYRFSLTVSSPRASIQPGDTLAMLAGEALAGSDTVGAIYFFFGEEITPRSIVNIRTTSIGNRLHYVRPPSLTPAFPNPSKRGTVVRFGYLVDRPSEVTFRIYAVTGEEIMKIEAPRITQEDVSRGQTLEFPITFDISSGIYFVQMVTNSGNAFTRMAVIR